MKPAHLLSERCSTNLKADSDYNAAELKRSKSVEREDKTKETLNDFRVVNCSLDSIKE